MFSGFERLVALRYLRSQKKQGFVSVITVFSFLGIALGVATLIVVMSVMNGFRAELLDRILGINAHVTITSRGTPITDYDMLRKQLETLPGVKKASPILHGQVMAMANGRHTGALVKGMTLDDLMKKELIASNITKGNPEQFSGTDTVILGSRMGIMLGVDVGDTISLISPKLTDTFLGAIPRLKDYTVVGFFNVGMFEYDSSTIFMPMEGAQLYFRSKHAVSDMEVMVDDPNETEHIVQEINEILPPDLFAVYDWKEANSHFFNSLKVERTVMFLILTLIIVVAAFNIISGMVMMVNDKGKEIAILRTMGATRGAIMRIFFMTGVAIGAVGTFLGFLLGYGFASNIETIRRWLESLTGTNLFDEQIYYLSTLPADLRNDDVVMVVVMSLALSFLATLYPAWKAASINPAEGVRYE